MFPQLTPQRTIAHFEELGYGGEGRRVGDIPEQKCTNLSSYSDSRFQLAEQVVAEATTAG